MVNYSSLQAPSACTRLWYVYHCCMYMYNTWQYLLKLWLFSNVSRNQTQSLNNIYYQKLGNSWTLKVFVLFSLYCCIVNTCYFETIKVHKNVVYLTEILNAWSSTIQCLVHNTTTRTCCVNCMVLESTSLVIPSRRGVGVKPHTAHNTTSSQKLS